MRHFYSLFIYSMSWKDYYCAIVKVSVSEARKPEEESSFWKISAERSRLEGEKADFQSLTPSQIKSLEKGEKPLPSYLRQVSFDISIDIAGAISLLFSTNRLKTKQNLSFVHLEIEFPLKQSLLAPVKQMENAVAATEMSSFTFIAQHHQPLTLLVTLTTLLLYRYLRYLWSKIGKMITGLVTLKMPQ